MEQSTHLSAMTKLVIGYRYVERQIPIQQTNIRIWTSKCNTDSVKQKVK